MAKRWTVRKDNSVVKCLNQENCGHDNHWLQWTPAVESVSADVLKNFDMSKKTDVETILSKSYSKEEAFTVLKEQLELAETESFVLCWHRNAHLMEWQVNGNNQLMTELDKELKLREYISQLRKAINKLKKELAK